MKKDELEKQYRLTLNSIKDIIDDFRNGSIEPDDDDFISSYDEIIDNILEIVDNALDKSKSQFEDFIDEQTSKTICRVVPLEPGARANYVIKHLKRDIDRCKACQEYNVRMKVDIKKDGIKYWKGITKGEYQETIKDYYFIKSQLHGKLKKHKPVFEELIMKGLTLEEYANLMRANRGNKMPQSYSIKWAFNKKQSFIKAIEKCYISEFASMKYYDGIQKENEEFDGRTYYMVEREIVSEALAEVDRHEKEYFLAMKEAYEKIYETVEELRKDKQEEKDIIYL